MTLRRLILAGIFLCGACVLRVQGNTLCDSLLSNLGTLPHNAERLETLNELRLAASDDAEKLHYADMLLAEAELQGSDRYKCEAYLGRIIAAYNVFDTKTLMSNMELLEPLARKGKYYDLLFRGWRCKIDVMILTQDYELNEKEAQKMLAEAQALDNQVGILEAYQCLGNIYKNTFRKKEAIGILEKARAMALESEQPCNTIINIWLSILILREETAEADDSGSMRDWIVSIKGFENYLVHDPQFADRRDPIFLIIYASALKYYSLVDDLPHAAEYCTLGEQLMPLIKSPIYRIYFNNASADYYTLTNQLEKGLEAMQENVRFLGAMSANSVDYHIQLWREADLLCSLKRPQEALPIFKRVFEFKDSLQVATINKQYEQLKHDFNTEQLLLEQGRIRMQMFVWVLALLAAGLVVVSYFIVYLLRSRRILTKAEGEMREMTRQVEQANEAKDRFLSNISTSIRVPLNEVVDGSLRLAMPDFNDPDERQALSVRIRTMSAGLLAMINDILDLSRLEAGMMKFEVRDTELLSLLLDAIATSEAMKCGTDIRTDFPDNRLFKMRADSTRIQQVFRSLFSREQQPGTRIDVTLREQDKVLYIRVAGTMQAQANPAQEVIIRNEINRMLVDHFGGSYQINDGEHPPVVQITLPLSEVLIL